MKEIRKSEPIKKIKNGLDEARKEFQEKTITLLLGGFGLVAALAWNEAIKTLFETVFPEKESELMGKFLYALIITTILAAISMQLKKFGGKDK